VGIGRQSSPVGTSATPGSLGGGGRRDLRRFFALRGPPPRSTLFPYTTLFRSGWPSRSTTPHRKCAAPPTTPPKRMAAKAPSALRWEEHTSELQSLAYLVCRLLLEKKKYCKSTTSRRA